jgi:arginase family enzyme
MDLAALRAAGLPDRLRQAGWEVSDAGDLTPQVFTADAAHPRARNRDAVVRACRDVAGAISQAIAAGRIPVLVGGNCSITAGAVAGCLAQQPRSEPGRLRRPPACNVDDLCTDLHRFAFLLWASDGEELSGEPQS